MQKFFIIRNKKNATGMRNIGENDNKLYTNQYFIPKTKAKNSIQVQGQGQRLNTQGQDRGLNC